MMDADAEGFTVAVVASKRLFKDAAADPTLVPNPKIGLSFLAVFDHFLGIPGQVEWSQWYSELITYGLIFFTDLSLKLSSIRFTF